MTMNLPNVGKQRDKREQVDRKDVRTVEVSVRGEFRLGGKTVNLKQLEVELVRAHQSNPKTVIYIRADENTNWKNVASVISICQRNGIVRVAPQTAPVN
jgi:biopolymer transport protein ExbD